MLFPVQHQLLQLVPFLALLKYQEHQLSLVVLLEPMSLLLGQVEARPEMSEVLHHSLPLRCLLEEILLLLLVAEPLRLQPGVAPPVA